MTSKEFVENFSQTLNKIEELTKWPFEHLVISDDPNCDCDYGVNANGMLILAEDSTTLPVEDLLEIRYRAKADYDPDDATEFYIHLRFSFDLEVYLYFYGLSFLGEEVALVFQRKGLPIEGIPAQNLLWAEDYDWASKNDFVATKGKLCKYLGSSNHVFIPDGINSIEERAFERSKLESVCLSDSVEHIGYRAFAFSSLKSIDLKNVTQIDKEAFWACKNLTSISLPDTCKAVAEEAFGRSGIRSLGQIDNHSNIELDDNVFLPLWQ